MENFNKTIDGFESSDLYAACCELEATIDWLIETGELLTMTFEDVVEFWLSNEQYEEYKSLGSEESYEEYCAIRQYVANDKKQYFTEMVNNLNSEA